MNLAYKLRLDFCLHLRLNIQKHPPVKSIQEENKQTNNMFMGWITGTCCAFMCLYSTEFVVQMSPPPPPIPVEEGFLTGASLWLISHVCTIWMFPRGQSQWERLFVCLPGLNSSSDWVHTCLPACLPASLPTGMSQARRWVACRADNTRTSKEIRQSGRLEIQMPPSAVASSDSLPAPRRESAVWTSGCATADIIASYEEI